MHCKSRMGRKFAPATTKGQDSATQGTLSQLSCLLLPPAPLPCGVLALMFPQVGRWGGGL